MRLFLLKANKPIASTVRGFFITTKIKMTWTIMDLWPVVEILTDNVQILAENLYIPVIASVIIGGIIAFIPEKYRKLWFLVSIAISTLIVFLAVKSWDVEANGYAVVLMWLMLWWFTSGGYSLVKKVFSKEENKTLSNDLPDEIWAELWPIIANK